MTSIFWLDSNIIKIYGFIQMEVDALGCKNNTDLEEKKVNDNIVLDVFFFLFTKYMYNPCFTMRYITGDLQYCCV